MSNPFLLDDETGFGALPPPSNPPRSNPEAEPKRDPSSSKSSSRAGSSHRLAPDDAPSDEKKSLLGAGADSAPGTALHDKPP